MDSISDRILHSIEKSGLSYRELSKATDIPPSALQRYASGETERVPINRIEAIAKATGVSAEYLLGWQKASADSKLPSNILPIRTYSIPLLGTIACGTPLLAVQNIESKVFVPDHIHADFALRCRGDSMIDARIHDGDIVYIRQQPMVDNGQIAAVLIGEEATLKRIYITPKYVSLNPCNPAYEPLLFVGEDINTVSILGLAVGFTSTI